MENNKRNTNMLIIITIAVFLITVIGATFAYFASEKTIGSSINANVGTAASMYSFTATSNGNIEMNIAFNEMSEASISSTVLKSDSASIAVSLSSPTDDTLTTCTYDIVWVWDDGDIYDTPDGGTLPIEDDTSTYNYEFSTMVDGANEKDLSNLEADGKTVKLQSGLSITSDSVAATTKTHTIVANIYNLPVEQTNLFNKKFKAHVTIDNLSCSMTGVTPLNITAEEGSLAYYLMNDVYKSTENQDNIKNKAAGLYYHNESLANGANDRTLRYSGADADVHNYVCFQNDDCVNNLYRIISVDSKTNQTKVIKAPSLGNMSWDKKADGSYKNTWEGSSLETYLNETYLTELKKQTNKIVETTWHVGGYTYDQMISSTPQAIYGIEKGDTTTYQKEIGLMYVSEYGFAALPEYWANTLGSYSLSKGKDWMLTVGYPWTISRNSDNNSAAFDGISKDSNMNIARVDRERSVHPSFVLSKDVKIINAGAGVGTSSNPMIIN